MSEEQTDGATHLIDRSAPIEERARRYRQRIQIHVAAVKSQYPGADVYLGWKRVPKNLRTRNQWAEKNHRVRSGSRPAGIVVVPESREVSGEDGRPSGLNDLICRNVKLYDASQTKLYKPTPRQLSTRKFFDIFVRPCSRARYGFWSEKEAQWKSCTGSLTHNHVASHLNGTNKYAVCGGTESRFIAIDLDIHHGDQTVFVTQLQILLTELCVGDGWHVQVANHDAGGVHLIKVVPHTSLETLRSTLRASLQLLDAKFPDQAQQASAAGMKSLGQVEIYPDPSRLFRLPLCAGRTMLLDQPLKLIANSRARNKVVQDVLGYMKWLEMPDGAHTGRNYMSTDDLVTYINERLRSTTKKAALPQPEGQHGTDDYIPKTVAAHKPMDKMSIGQSIVEFWSGTNCPPDSLNTFIVMTARLLRYEVTRDDAITILEQYCNEHPAPGFSTRLSSGDFPEIARVIRNTVRIVYENNGGQRDPETSTRILSKAHSYFQKIGFRISDKSTWDTLQHPAPRLGPDFEWTPEEVQQIEQYLVPVLKVELETAKAVTKHFLRFVKIHENQEISRDSLPTILRDFPINIRKASKKSRFLQELITLGWLTISRNHTWQPRASGLAGHARHYQVGPHLSAKFMN